MFDRQPGNLSKSGAIKCRVLFKMHSSKYARGWEIFPLVFVQKRQFSVFPQRHYGYLTTMTDIVAVWEVSLSDGIHKVEFEHGTTSGMRVIRIDNKVSNSQRQLVRFNQEKSAAILVLCVPLQFKS